MVFRLSEKDDIVVHYQVAINFHALT